MCCGSVYILSSLFSGQASAREESVGGLSLNPSRAHTHARRCRAGLGFRELSRAFFLLQSSLPKMFNSINNFLLLWKLNIYSRGVTRSHKGWNIAAQLQCIKADLNLSVNHALRTVCL